MQPKPNPADFTHNGELQQPHYDNAVRAWEKLERIENGEGINQEQALELIKELKEHLELAQDSNYCYDTQDIIDRAKLFLEKYED